MLAFLFCVFAAAASLRLSSESLEAPSGESTLAFFVARPDAPARGPDCMSGTAVLASLCRRLP